MDPSKAAHLLYHDVNRIIVLHFELRWRVFVSDLDTVVKEFNLRASFRDGQDVSSEQQRLIAPKHALLDATRRDPR